MIVLTCAACFSESDAESGGDQGSSGTMATTATTNGASTSSSGTDATSSPTSGTTDTISDTISDTMADTMADSTTASDCGPMQPVPPFDDSQWSGPIVIVHGVPMMPPLDCPDGFDEDGAPVVGVAGPSMCECTCDEALWERCHVTITTGPDLMCTGPMIAATAACQGLGVAVDAVGKSVTPGECMANPHAVPPEGEGPTTLCTPSEPDAACIAVPEGTQGPCIYTQADTGCPGEYPNGVPSKRPICSTCTSCTDLPSYCTALHVELFSTDDCSGASQATAAVCTMGDVPTIAVRLVETMPYSCSSDEVTPNPVSICCAG